MWTARVSKQGQETISKEVRKFLGLSEGNIITFMEEEGKVLIKMAFVVPTEDSLRQTSNE